MKCKLIYVETSIFSYLAAHTSRDLVVSAWQEVTREFWDQHREAYDLVTSQLVVEESIPMRSNAGWRCCVACRNSWLMTQ